MKSRVISGRTTVIATIGGLITPLLTIQSLLPYAPWIYILCRCSGDLVSGVIIAVWVVCGDTSMYVHLLAIDMLTKSQDPLSSPFRVHGVLKAPLSVVIPKHLCSQSFGEQPANEV